MTEWLLIITVFSHYGASVTTVKVPDKDSCYRAARVFKLACEAEKNDYLSTQSGCVEIKKETK